jgi:hypothetical protein
MWSGSAGRVDAQGVLAGTRDADRCLAYLGKYLTKSVAAADEAGGGGPSPQGRPEQGLRADAVGVVAVGEGRRLASVITAGLVEFVARLARESAA